MSRAKTESQHLHALLMKRFPAAFPKDYDAIKPLKKSAPFQPVLIAGDKGEPL